MKLNHSFRYRISLCAGLLLLVIPVRGQSQEATSPSAATPPSTGKKLTPEERQERKLAKEREAVEEEQLRLEIFGVIPEEDQTPLANAYRKALENFRRATAEFADMQARLQFQMDFEKVQDLKSKWLEKLSANHDQLMAYRAVAAQLYASDPTRYETVGLILREMLLADIALDRTEGWAKPARALLEGGNLLTEEVAVSAGYAGLANYDWELVGGVWSELANAGKLPDVETQILARLPEIAADWEKEKIRIEEDAAKDNPRVEIYTTKGILVIELFEDDAPEAVASFIYLVENGYYDRKPIFLVRQHLLAQTGCEKGDGKGTAGYTIRHEAGLPNRRNHFRGYLGIPLSADSETQTIDPNSGGAQFYFTFLPLPLLDGRHTVFGRVIEGQETLGLFKVVNMADEEERKDPSLRPDSIVRAKVLRKRDHEYRPTPAMGRLPR